MLSAHHQGLFCSLSARGFPEGPLFCPAGESGDGSGLELLLGGVSVLPSICNKKVVYIRGNKTNLVKPGWNNLSETLDT